MDLIHVSDYLTTRLAGYGGALAFHIVIIVLQSNFTILRNECTVYIQMFLKIVHCTLPRGGMNPRRPTDFPTPERFEGRGKGRHHKEKLVEKRAFPFSPKFP